MLFKGSGFISCLTLITSHDCLLIPVPMDAAESRFQEDEALVAPYPSLLSSTFMRRSTRISEILMTPGILCMLSPNTALSFNSVVRFSALILRVVRRAAFSICDHLTHRESSESVSLKILVWALISPILAKTNPDFKNTTQIPRADTQRETKRAKRERESEKKRAKFWAVRRKGVRRSLGRVQTNTTSTTQRHKQIGRKWIGQNWTGQSRH